MFTLLFNNVWYFNILVFNDAFVFMCCLFSLIALPEIINNEMQKMENTMKLKIIDVSFLMDNR